MDGAIAEMREFVRLGGIPGWRDGAKRLAALVEQREERERAWAR